MEIYYEDTNITQNVQPRSCVLTDTCGERSDALEIEFENGAAWQSWAPQEDDRIRLTHNGYDSGDMYINAVLPEEGRYRIWATALPCRAKFKENRSYTGLKISEILNLCAGATGLEWALYGIEPNIVIPYIQQTNESCAAFLRRLLRYEGAVLKVVNGCYTVIGIEYAQALEAAQTIALTLDQGGAIYQRSGRKVKRLSIETPFTVMTAADSDVDESHPSIVVNDPAVTDIQALRWARNMLLDMNQACETLTVESEFNPGFTAMGRVDISGETDASGEWIIREVEHDFINLRSTATMRRCVWSIS